MPLLRRSAFHAAMISRFSIVLAGMWRARFNFCRPANCQPRPIQIRARSRSTKRASFACLTRYPSGPCSPARRGCDCRSPAHTKVPVVLVDGAVALPAPGQPTTHILKPPIARFCGTARTRPW